MALNKTTPPIIPFMPLILKDMTFTHEVKVNLILKGCPLMKVSSDQLDMSIWHKINKYS